MAGLALAASMPDLATAEPVAVRFLEGVTRGFLVVSAVDGKPVGQGDIRQVAHPGRVESRMILRFRDGSLHDETVTYTQDKVFKLGRFRLIQKGPSFPEPVEISLEAASGEYLVKSHPGSADREKTYRGTLELPPDTYNGLLLVVLKNLPAGGSARVHYVAFTPKPYLIGLDLLPQGPGKGPGGSRVATGDPVRAQAGPGGLASDWRRRTRQDPGTAAVLDPGGSGARLRGLRGAPGHERATLAYRPHEPGADAQWAGQAMSPAPRPRIRERIALAFTYVEDVVYLALALLLAAGAIGLVANTGLIFARVLAEGTLAVGAVAVLDRVLLVLMVVELLYTVQVSFREHKIAAEPFLLVAMIASVRRIIVLNAEMAETAKRGGEAFRAAMIETGLLTFVVLAMVGALVVLRRQAPIRAERAV